MPILFSQVKLYEVISNMYAMKVLFWVLLFFSNVDVVDGRHLDLDVALDKMRKRLESATASTDPVTIIDNHTEAPYITYVTSTTAVSDASVDLLITPPMLPASEPSTIHSHGSLVRAVLDRISRECTLRRVDIGMSTGIFLPPMIKPF